MPFNLLLLPLLGGYIFTRYWNRTRYHVLRAEKERLLIFASIAGLAALILAFFLVAAVAPLFPCQEGRPCIPRWWRSHAPFEYSGTSFLAFLLGAVCWYPLNWYWDRDSEINRLIEEDKAPFELLLKKAQDQAKTVSVTMKSGKVYVGFVLHAFNPARPIQFITILPTKSGYRDSTTKWLNFTTYYSEALENINKDYDAKETDLESASKQLEAGEKEYEKNKDRKLKERLDHLRDVVTALERELADLDVKTEDFSILLPLSEISSINIYNAYIHTQYFPPKSTT